MELLPNLASMERVKSTSTSLSDHKPTHQWTNNETPSLSPWETIDLDWMSKAEEEEDMEEEKEEEGETPTTEQYRTKVYSQSITLVLRLQPNESDVSASGLLENPLEVGPWKVPRDSIPVLVGSVAGGCCLLLLGISLALYICLHRRQTTKAYSVKSEASSVLSSTRSPKSVLSLSRDSLVLVTGPSSGHQARLLSDPSASNTFLFDYSFDFYFDSNTDSLKNSQSLRNNNEFHKFKNSCIDASNNQLQRTASAKEHRPTNHQPSIISASVEANGRIEHLPLDCRDGKRERPSPTHSHRGSSVPQYEVNLAPPSTEMDERLSKCSSRISCANSGVTMTSESCFEASDEALKTRSLPAWVRSKNRPLAYHTDLSSSLYEKKCGHYLPRRQRNRMGSDAAQLIALSRSRLMSPGSNPSVCPPVVPPTPIEAPFEEFINEAVIVYNERTAL